jgi:hypothetical protein
MVRAGKRQFWLWLFTSHEIRTQNTEDKEDHREHCIVYIQLGIERRLK